MIVLPYLAAVRFSGADAGDFLHNQLSADILGLSAGASSFACYCEPKGRVLGLLLVTPHGGDYYALLSATLAPAIIDRLKIYVLRSQVTIEALDNTAVIGLRAGDKSRRAPGSLPPVPMPGCDEAFQLAADTPPDCGDVAGQDAWKVMELRRGITWLCPETSGEFLPQWLGFDRLGAINFKKGCFPGQEIVARTHYLGKVKRHPRLLCTRAAICPEPLDKIGILAGEDSYEGVITDRGHNEDGGGCLFVVTRMDPGLQADGIEYCGQICPVA